MPRPSESIRKEWGLKMNGSTQYWQHSDNAAYDVLDNISISMWFKRNGTGKKFLMSKGTNGFGMYIDPNNKLTLTKPNVADLVTGKKIIVDKAWHQVVMTLGGGTASIYFDGVLDNSAATGTTFAATATGVFVGQDSGNLFHFDGSIKDVRVNNGLWSASDVLNLYAAGPNTTYLSSNLVLWAKVNEGTGTTITDSSSTANNGTITGRTTTGATPTTMWVIDPVRPPRRVTTGDTSSILFNGSSDRIVVPHAAALNVGTGNFTIEAKVFVRKVGAYEFIADKFDTVGGVGWQLYFSESTITGFTNKFVFFFQTGPGVAGRMCSNIEVTAGRWYHLIGTVTRSAAATEFKLFVNGVLDCTYNSTGEVASITGTLNNTVALDIGHRNNAATVFLDGGAYDVRHYTGVMTDDECLARYYQEENITANRVGWWKMNETTGTSIADSQGSNTGTLTGGTFINQVMS